MSTVQIVQGFQLEQEDISILIKFQKASFWKRLFDLFVASLVALFVLTWLIPLIGFLIKISSPGPIFFSQPRTGLYGHTFNCLKFRTMIFAPQEVTFRQTDIGDPRVTRVGYWLRKTNLDEMPQFFNVLMGHMSVVGPRPHAVPHDNQFWFVLPDYSKRYLVMPGITGLAQVRGSRGIANDVQKMEHRLKYDLLYIKRQSLKYDVLICWWTVKSMVLGDPNAW